MCAKTHSSTPLQMGQKQQPHLTQRLIMSAQMQQAIRLLQLPLLELGPFIEEQVVLNPLLELSEANETPEDPQEQEETSTPSTQESEQEISISDQDLTILSRLEEDWREHFAQNEVPLKKRTSEEEKFKTFLEQSILSEPNLRDQLLQEAHYSFAASSREFQIAEILIGYIDSYGFLKTPLSEICLLHDLTESEVRSVLTEIQTFEPYGVGASNIQESLLIQLRCLHKEETLAYRIVRDYYEQLLHNHIPFIQRQLKCSYEDIQQAIDRDIAKLDLHPGTQYSSRAPHSLVPDVTLRQEDQRLVVEVERDYVPSLHLNHRYLKMLRDPSVSTETKHFIKHHVFSARWLMRNLQQRYSTLERIAQVLADKQYDFFTQPDGQLVPLTMKTLADELNVHESTIARTVSNKYLYSPRGLFPLRMFFTNKYVSESGKDLSSATVRNAIVDLLAKEDKNHPLSDEKISRLLKQQGISCARRTVAKYRLALQIGNTQQRKKFH